MTAIALIFSPEMTVQQRAQCFPRAPGFELGPVLCAKSRHLNRITPMPASVIGGNNGDFYNYREIFSSSARIPTHVFSQSFNACSTAAPSLADVRNVCREITAKRLTETADIAPSLALQIRPVGYPRNLKQVNYNYSYWVKWVIKLEVKSSVN